MNLAHVCANVDNAAGPSAHVAAALSADVPFFQQHNLDEDVLIVIQKLVDDSSRVKQGRRRMLEHWCSRAEQLEDGSDPRKPKG